MSTDVVEQVKVAFSVIPESEVKRPNMRAVIMLNDDYTPMEFVVEVLTDIFNLKEQEATKVMLQVHYSGKGLCGRYPTDIAETKVAQVINLARIHGYPLLCQTEIS